MLAATALGAAAALGAGGCGDDERGGVEVQDGTGTTGGGAGTTGGASTGTTGTAPEATGTAPETHGPEAETTTTP